MMMIMMMNDQMKAVILEVAVEYTALSSACVLAHHHSVSYNKINNSYKVISISETIIIWTILYSLWLSALHQKR